VCILPTRAPWPVGTGGTILATRDGGTNCEPQKTGTAKTLANLHFADLHIGWAVGEDGTILVTRDGGTHWEPQDSETDLDLASVNGHAFWAGVRGGSGHRRRLAADQCRFCCGDMVGGLFYDNHPAGTRLLATHVRVAILSVARRKKDGREVRSIATYFWSRTVLRSRS
jgi:hypothetical protein